MSTALVTALVLAFYGLALAPLAAVAWRRRGGRLVAVGYLSAVLAVSALSVGWFSRQGLTPVADIHIAVPTTADRCEQFLDVLEEARVINRRAPPAEMIVDRQSWDQLPGPVRDVAMACAEEARGSGGTETNILAPPQS